jgi:hypothetical protein
MRFAHPSGRLGRNALAVVLAGLLLVVSGAGPAQAHVIGIGGRASNYRTDILDVTPPIAGLLCACSRRATSSS